MSQERFVRSSFMLMTFTFLLTFCLGTFGVIFDLSPAHLCPYLDDRRSSWHSMAGCSVASAYWPRWWRPAILSEPLRRLGSRNPASAAPWRGSRLGAARGC